jgi:hypothetical protein
MNDYSELVIALHDIARAVEVQLGICQISEDIRNCADRLHQIGEPLKVSND